jgi:hypothetical protein
LRYGGKMTPPIPGAIDVKTWIPFTSPYEFCTLYWRTFMNPTAYPFFSKKDATEHRIEIACQFWAICMDYAVDVSAKE